MAGMDTNTPRPTEIKLRQKLRVLEISFSDGKAFQLPCEFLRIYSPSAEVRGHGPGQEVLQTGKKPVEITKRQASGLLSSHLSKPTAARRAVVFYLDLSRNFSDRLREDLRNPAVSLFY